MDIQHALNPKRSVVVEACAGSGKTWLLVSRIIRLLLDGVKPGEILAITFTRKAAQEMQLRLRDWLYDLATKDEAFVVQFLRERSVAEADILGAIPRARLLYQQFLLAQPNITISTFHGWFVQLLQRAPINAGVAGGGQLAEHTEFLLSEAWQLWLEQLNQTPDCAAAKGVEYLFEQFGLDNTQQLLFSFIEKRSEWWVFTQGQTDSLVFAQQTLLNELQIDLSLDPFEQCIQNPLLFDHIKQFAQLFTATDAQRKTADELLGLLYLDLPSKDYFELIWNQFFTQKGTLRVFRITKNQDASQFSAYAELVASHLLNAKNIQQSQAIYWQNLHGLNCGVSLLNQFQQLKQQQQVMDFGDLEWRVYQLLKQSDDAAYLLAKLDSRYHHVLLDEFQDTNPLQWQILQAWFQASNEVESAPIVFLVGDPKQSIYRFRRADARLFDAARVFLQEQFDAVYLSQNTTRRNAPAILDVLNRVFLQESQYTGFVPHQAFQKHLPAYVACLPLTQSEKSKEHEKDDAGFSLRNPLFQPFQEYEDLSRQLEAEQFADWIQSVVDQWQIDDEGESRPALYSDIMILVRRRTYLRIYEQALRERHIPYLSSRRGGLLESLEALDLQALLSFLMTPLSDLNLAQVLRCPIFACSDEDLLQLCRSAEGKSLWQKLQQYDNASERLIRARCLLQSWIPLAERLPVHDLLDRIYFESDVVDAYRQTVVDSLVQSVEANLQAFLEIALNIDAGRYPSLPAFLHALQQLQDASDNVSPDEGKISQVGNAIRIYTIHESKGLEAPIVCLLDSNTTREQDERYQVLIDWPIDAERPQHFSLFADKASRGLARAHYFEAEEALAQRENLNLLYVAMTRAKQVLIVTGNGGATTESWFGKIQQALDVDAKPLPNYSHVARKQATSVQSILDYSVWQSPLPTGQIKAKNTQQQQYGIWLHATLELLLNTDQEAVLPDLSFMPITEQEQVYQHALFILSQVELHRFFDSNCYINAYNELALVNQYGQLQRIDRLVEFEDQVWILDYKSSTNVQISHAEQLDAYQHTLASLYPDKTLYKAVILGNGKLHTF